MDSGTNSASLQSSSTGGGGVVGGGGDEEYDSSRAVTNSDAFSSAFHTQNSAMFDPFANYFNPIYRPQPPPSSPPPPPSQNYTSTGNSIFDIDWSPAKRIRTDQITTNSNPMLLSSSDNSSHFLNNSLSFGGTTTPGSISFPSSSQEHQHRGAGSGNVSVATSTVPAAVAADQPPARNPKKRSRASRRAPTTVLTTDTTNFRAMVQEFTGIPAPPFPTPSYFPQRNRFDLFTSTPNSASNSAMRSAVAAPAAAANNNPFSISQPPPLNYLRRAFLQSIQQPTPFISPSSASSSLMLNCLPNNFACGSSTTSSAANSSINYQLPGGVVNSVSSASNATINYQLPSSGVANSVTQGSNLFSTIQQNSMFTSLLQSPQKYSIGSKEQEQFQMASNSNSQFQMASNSSSQFQMPSSVNNNIQHGHLLSELPNLISPEQAPAAAITAASSNDNSINAANFHDNKVQETVASRGGEGMVESWLLSSD